MKTMFVNCISMKLTLLNVDFINAYWENSPEQTFEISNPNRYLKYSSSFISTHTRYRFILTRLLCH